MLKSPSLLFSQSALLLQSVHTGYWAKGTPLAYSSNRGYLLHEEIDSSHGCGIRMRVVKVSIVLFLVSLLTGCVERRFLVESTPPGAKVYVNNVPVGFTPVDAPFTYYGKYDITLEKEGFQTETFQWRLAAPWWAYPPFDFLTEHIYPLTIQDIRRETFEMKPAVVTNIDELRLNAEELRKKGQALPEPKNPLPPKTNPNSGVAGP